MSDLAYLAPHVELLQVDGIAVLKLSGEFDLHAVGGLEEAFDSVAARSRRVVVDLTEVQFFDSTALGLGLGLRRLLLSEGGRLALVIGGREALRVFQISGLDRIFTLAPTLEDALRLVSANGR